MSPAGKPIVIDASVAVKLFIREELDDKAQDIFLSSGSDEALPLFVPDLFFIECANVFRGKVKMREMSSENAISALSILLQVPLESFPAKDLANFALHLSLRHDLSVYDGCYLALATLIGAPLITADRKLVRKLAGSEPPVIWLGEWSI